MDYINEDQLDILIMDFMSKLNKVCFDETKLNIDCTSFDKIKNQFIETLYDTSIVSNLNLTILSKTINSLTLDLIKEIILYSLEEVKENIHKDNLIFFVKLREELLINEVSDSKLIKKFDHLVENFKNVKGMFKSYFNSDLKFSENLNLSKTKLYLNYFNIEYILYASTEYGHPCTRFNSKELFDQHEFDLLESKIDEIDFEGNKVIDLVLESINNCFSEKLISINNKNKFEYEKLQTIKAKVLNSKENLEKVNLVENIKIKRDSTVESIKSDAEISSGIKFQV